MEWLPPSLNGIVMCQSRGVYSHGAERTATHGYNDRGGLGKVGFSAAWRIDGRGGAVSQKANAPTVRKVHVWARRMRELGHEVKLIAPQYVRPFVKRQKNDAADAEAIVIAAPGRGCKVEGRAGVLGRCGCRRISSKRVQIKFKLRAVDNNAPDKTPSIKG